MLDIKMIVKLEEELCDVRYSLRHYTSSVVEQSKEVLDIKEEINDIKKKMNRKEGLKKINKNILHHSCSTNIG